MAPSGKSAPDRAGDKDKALEAALLQIERQFGKGSIMRLGEDTRVPVEVIPTGSIALDVALGIGGLPRGRIVEIYGPESSGKTTLALHALANAQKMGGIAAFIDAEHALDPEYAQRLGVDTEALLVSQPDTGEQALEIMDMLIRSGAIDIVVVDSVAALVPKAEIEGEMGDSHVGLLVTRSVCVMARGEAPGTIPSSSATAEATQPAGSPLMAPSGKSAPDRAGDKDKALEAALLQIERQFGKGSIMRLGEETRVPVEVIPTGSIALDVALGIGGLPRGRIVEIYGPESSGKTTLALHALANAQKMGGIAAFIDAEHALDPEYAQKLGVDTEALLVSQPDTGEQALEIMDMLIRSGAIDIVVVDSVAALVPKAEIEGEMGDSHVGLQARLMSQALRKITGAVSNTKTTAIFINQLREKVGVMFGCLSYGTRVTLADGTQEKIGKIVNQRMDVEVLSYDAETDRMVPRKIVNWFDNGNAERFLQFTVAKSGKNGRAQFAATENHLIRTPGGWCEAGELIAGDRLMVAEDHLLSDQQIQVILGSLMGDGNLSPNRRGRSGTRFRMGHGAQPGRLPGLESVASRQHPALAHRQRQGCGLRRLHAAARTGRAARDRLLR